MNRDGVGLGLNICQRILEQFDGELRVFSAGQNLGSTFMFSMRMNVHKEEPQQPSEDEKFESAALSGKFQSSGRLDENRFVDGGIMNQNGEAQANLNQMR